MELKSTAGEIPSEDPELKKKIDEEISELDDPSLGEINKIIQEKIKEHKSGEYSAQPVFEAPGEETRLTI